MKKIPIEQASLNQLRFHAETVLGLEPIPAVGTSKATVIAKIQAAVPGTTEISLADEPDSLAQTTAELNTAQRDADAAQAKVEAIAAQADKYAGMSPKQAAQHHNDPIIEVMIPQSPEPGGDRDVPVAVNGMQWTIKRDTWVKVPYRVFEALLHAKETRYEHTNDEIGRMQVTERDVPSYAFSSRNGPTDEEIAAWRERTAAVELA